MPESVRIAGIAAATLSKRRGVRFEGFRRSGILFEKFKRGFERLRLIDGGCSVDKIAGSLERLRGLPELRSRRTPATVARVALFNCLGSLHV
ncbi:hypothetical protein JQ589_31190 [Bradyrhizobium japonicum]|uniref:hypothetical protein n=1 Tax=Bradyrhizobium japonicum TaxID=375 RepID=UPI001BAA8D41|nr:hypothetical protein [Bradyrhizobium japonicum]